MFFIKAAVVCTFLSKVELYMKVFTCDDTYLDNQLETYNSNFQVYFLSLVMIRICFHALMLQKHVKHF